MLKIKRGYLNEDFRFFQLKDKRAEEHNFHYHDFNKIVVFLSGNVTYAIEGKYYKLRPWDILFISSGELHKPIIDPDEYYERIIIWVNSSFLENHSTEDSNLLSCFNIEKKEEYSLLRLIPDDLDLIKEIIFSVERATKDMDFGGRILQNSYFIQLIVYLSRFMLNAGDKREEKDVRFDERVVSILNYVNANLGEDLSIDSIAKRFYINRYYLMHNFKNQTGYTLHSYILEKRLAKAAALLRKGLQASYASQACGFQDYSSFVRAFKKSFGLSPKLYYKAIKEIESSNGESDFDDKEPYPFRE